MTSASASTPLTGLCTAAGPGIVSPDVALTWMEARTGGREVTPRHGKPVEVNTLWINGAPRRALNHVARPLVHGW